MKKDTFAKPEVQLDTVELKEEKSMKEVKSSKSTDEIFYYGMYSVDHPTKKGQYMEVLKDKGERRKCPCNSIAISIDDVKKMVALGYRFNNLDKSVFSEPITKYSFDRYYRKVSNLIKNGFLVEK